MPFVPVPNTAMIEMRMLLDLQKCENTLYVESTDPWDASALEALANRARAWWVDQYADIVVNDCSLREVVASDLTTEAGLQVGVSGGGASGTLEESPLPNNVSLAVSFRTGLRGRSFRGRNYICGMPVSVLGLSQNVVNAPYAAHVITVYEEFKTAVPITGQTWVVVSRFSGVDSAHKPIPRPSGVTTEVLNVVVADLTIDSMRRRLPGRGN